MKHLIIKAAVAVLVVFLSLPVLAVEVEIDGINYELIPKGKVATVIGHRTGSYSGDIVIPESVEYEGRTCSVTEIRGWAFWDCTGLTSVTIPNSVTGIGRFAFYNCSGLTSITIPNSVTTIGAHAFDRCRGLTSVTIPNSVKSIEDGAFYGCAGLTSVTIGNNVTEIGDSAFEKCSGLTSVTIPNSVTSIEVGAFAYCEDLTSVTIGNGVTSIGDGAFYGCRGLTSVTIDNGVTGIGCQAFAGCPKLLDVYCHAEKVPYTESDAFENSYPEYATLHVPATSIEIYNATIPWSGFGKIIGLSAEEPEVSGEKNLVDGEGQRHQFSSTSTAEECRNHIRASISGTAEKVW